MDDKHLTTKAIRKGFLTFEQMLECLRLQDSARKEGLTLSLADILIRKGFLTTEQIQLLRADTKAGGQIETPALTDTSAAMAQPVSESIRLLELLGGVPVDVTGPETPEPEPAPISLNVDFESVMARREKEIANKPTESGWTELPRSIGPFEILMKLGQGEMGLVYRAAPSGQASPVALRVFPEVFARDRELLDRFESEKKAKLGLAHPNLVKIFDYGVIDGKRYFSTSEFIDGKSLWEYVEERGALPERDALSFTLQIAHAIQAVHSAGLVHRNLKPDRVLLDEAARVRVLEPGLKRSGITVTGLSYMSPESNKGMELDFSTDLYSLGATMYFMVTGLHPFSAPSPQESLKKQLDGEVPNAKMARSSLSQGTADLIRRLMDKEKGQRPKNIAEILPDIEKLLGEAPLPSPQDPASQTNRFPRLKTEQSLFPAKWKRAILRRRLIVGSLVVFVILCIVLLMMATQP